MRILNLLLLASFMFVSTSAIAEVVGKDVEYKSNSTTLKGYLAYDNSIEGKRPGILVVHEWWGHNDYARSRADKLAALGYTALAVDMYGDGKKADHPEKAGELATGVLSNLDEAEKRFQAALTLLKEQSSVNPEHVAAIGYCFGGAVVLNMALRGVDLDGVASFHGLLPASGPENTDVKAKVVVFHGGADPFVPQEQMDAFKKAMDNANADYDIVIYPEVQHSFTSPGADEIGKKFDLPLVYNEQADKDSWEKFQAFLKTIFQPENN